MPKAQLDATARSEVHDADEPPDRPEPPRAARAARDRPPERRPVAADTEAMFEAMAAAPDRLDAPVGGPLGRTPRDDSGPTMLGTEAALFVPNVDDRRTCSPSSSGSSAGRRSCSTPSPTSTSSSGTGCRSAVSCREPSSSDRGHLDPAAKSRRRSPTAPAAGRPRIGLLVLENTHTFAGGVAITRTRPTPSRGLAHRHGALVHLDGARLFNAAVALGVPPAALTRARRHDRGQPEQGPVRPVRRAARRPAPRRRARPDARLPDRVRADPQGGLSRCGRDRRARDDGRPARRRSPPRAPARRGTGPRIDGLDVDLETVQTNLVQRPPRRAVRRARGRRGAPRGARRRRHGDARRMLRAVVHRAIDDDDIETAVRAVSAALARSCARCSGVDGQPRQDAGSSSG